MKQSELILNSDGSVYHLNLLPGDVAPLVILVGDQNRVPWVSKYFDEILVSKSKREFVTHTGRIGNTLLSVVSTGIGTDNIDIVINEIDALFNIDFDQRVPRRDLVQLDFIRVGTSGAIQKDIPLDCLLLSSCGLGMDAMSRMDQSHADASAMEWFAELDRQATAAGARVKPAYISVPDRDLAARFSGITERWITATCGGFYGLQGRSLRLESNMRDTMQFISGFEYNGQRVGNLEMETAGIYLLAGLLGHRAVSLNAIVANRKTGTFSRDPYATIDRLIQTTLRTLS